MNSEQETGKTMMGISKVIANLPRLSECGKRNGVTKSNTTAAAMAASSTTADTAMSKMGSMPSADGGQGYTPRFARMMAELWVALTAHWGNAFTSRHGDVWQDDPTWQSEMRGLTKNQILAGLEVCKYDERFAEWPPAARVFRAIALRQPMRAGGKSADEVFAEVCRYYADECSAEAVWIIRQSKDWEALRKGDAGARCKFDALWLEMQAFVGAGGQLPEPVRKVPRIERKAKPADWGRIRALMGGAA